MKRPAILVVPIAAKLLLCASGIPIHQNHDNGVVTRSIPSSLSPIDSTLVQRSDRHDQPFAFSFILTPDDASNSQHAQSSTHGAPTNFPGHGAAQHVQLPTINPYHPNPTSSAPLNNGAEPAPDDPDKLPTPIPEELYGKPAHAVAAKLRGTGTLSVDKVIDNMILMKVFFKRELETERNRPETTLQYWRPEMEAFANEPSVSHSDRLQWWKRILGFQMEALAKLYAGRRDQSQWDGYWIDDKSFTTRLTITGEKANMNVLSIIATSLLRGGREKLTTPGNDYYSLIYMATQLVNDGKGLDNCINNALVLRRKAIQLRMLSQKQMRIVEFNEHKKILRGIASTDDLKIRAEMVIFSLQRFIEEHAIQIA